MYVPLVPEKLNEYFIESELWCDLDTRTAEYRLS